MNTKNFFTASVLGALVTTALTNIPFIDLLICFPYWSGPLLAGWLYKRQSGTLPLSHALGLGTMTGLCAGVLSNVLILIWANSSVWATRLGQYMSRNSAPSEILTAETFVVSLLSVLIYLFFGVVGGFIAGVVFRDKPAMTTL